MAAAAESKHTTQHRRSRVISQALVLLASTLFLTLGLVAPALAIPRDATLARGLSWINVQVPYSQSRYYAGYRTDCSGFVSMCWNLPYSYNTRTLYQVSYPITADDLQPGDALLRAGYHVRLFAGWADAEQTKYIAYEETSPGAVQTVKTLATDLASGYIPYRYYHIGSLAPGWSALKNPYFDWFASDTAIFWTASRDASGTVSRRRRDIKSTPLNSLGVINHSTNPSEVEEVTQSCAVEPGKKYMLDGMAWTDRNPSAVRVRLRVTNAAGASLVDTFTPGDRLGLTWTAMKPFTMVQVMPATATTATVSLMLYGGAYVATDTVGTAIFDDVRLYVTSPAPVYRFFNRRTGTHFYTISGSERDYVLGWLWTTYDYEGVAYFVSDSPANTQNLYRFYDRRTGAHFYTASDTERDRVIRELGYRYQFEGPAYRVAPAPVANCATVYRFFNARTGTHFYTASDTERDNVIATLAYLYRFEGPAFYIAP